MLGVAWWHVSALWRRRVKQDARQFKASLGYIVRPCLKKQNKTKIRQLGAGGSHL
jgi:hypothetical protein